MKIWTIGHSTRALPAFLGLLADAGIERLVDVRRLPASRRHPHFSRAPLAAALAAAGIEYVHMEPLGGHREPRPDSRNTAWKEPAFRGYADHMESAEFARALAELEALARQRRTAFLCAEADWRNCHRGLLSDRLRIAGWEVVHLATPRGVEEHPWTKAARVDGGRLTYDAPRQLDLDLE